MQALKVGHLWGVAAFNQGLKTGLDQLNAAATEYGLLTEQIGFGLVFEGGLDDAGTTATHA